MNYLPLSAAFAAFRYSMVLGLVVHALAAQEAKKTDEKKDETQKLEVFEVTGSRVKRLDYETTSPVVTYTASAIDEKGYTSLGEFVQSLPFNSASANSEFTAGTFIPGAATINPRGLGSNRVLTLVNGRRAVPYALTDNSGGTAQSVFNFNSIPQSAIDRVEYLKDGASAIYGSDAITGVYNIILKKNYEGSSVELLLSNSLKHDMLTKRVNIFTGLSKDGWEITGGATLQSRHSSFISDYGVTTTDYRSLGVKGINQNSTIYHPSYLNLSTAQAVAAGLGTTSGVYIIPNSQGSANPTRSSFVLVSGLIPNSNRYEFANVTQFQPASDSGGGYASIQKIINPHVTAFTQFLYSRTLTHYVGAGLGYTNSLAGITLPASNPYNPTGLSFTNTATVIPFTFRGDTLPKRDVTSTTATALAGLRGTLRKIWSWETAVTYGRNETGRDTDQISVAALQAALNGTTRATAWNPFGPSDNPDIEKNLYSRSHGLDGTFSSFSHDGQISGSFYQLPFKGAGELSLAAGYEFRFDKQVSNPDPIPYIGLTPTAPYSGKRDVKSAFSELAIPVQKWLEFQVAGRHERYSDFGQTTKPKYGVKVRLPSTKVLNVLLRASYSESFKAPDIGQLYQPQTVASTLGAVSDPLRPQDGARSLRVLIGGNAKLKPEEGKVQFAGAVFEVPAVKGLSFSVDFFDIQITNVIRNLSSSYLLTNEGRRLFPDAVVRDNSVSNPGPILYVLGISNNLGLQLYRGVDYGARYTLRNTRWGTFSFDADATQIVKRGSDAGTGAGFFDNVGLYFDVRWRYNYGVGWRYKNFGAALRADIIGKFFNDRQGTATFAGWGENPYTVLTPTFSYRGFKKMTISVTANNVLDNRPPPNGNFLLGFDDRAYSSGALGRIVTLRARREF